MGFRKQPASSVGAADGVDGEALPDIHLLTYSGSCKYDLSRFVATSIYQDR